MELTQLLPHRRAMLLIDAIDNGKGYFQVKPDCIFATPLGISTHIAIELAAQTFGAVNSLQGNELINPRLLAVKKFSANVPYFTFDQLLVIELIEVVNLGDTALVNATVTGCKQSAEVTLLVKGD